MPEPDRLDERMLERFGDFLDRHTEAGHGDDPHLHRRPHVRGELGPGLAAGARPVRRRVDGGPAGVVRAPGDRRFAGHPAVAGLAAVQRDAASTAARRPAPARRPPGRSCSCRRCGPGADPAGLARRRRLGHRDERATTTASRCATTAPLVDFLGPHVYRMENDRVRQHCGAGVRLRAGRHFAASPWCWRSSASAPASPRPANAAHYYRQVLHNTLLAGATGWIAWNNTDYDDLADQDPYRHHPFEMHFGLTTPPASPSRSCAEMRAFAEVLERGRLPGAAPGRRPTPRWSSRRTWTRALPVHRARGPQLRPRLLRQAYVAAGRRTCRSGRCGSATVSPPTPRSTWCRPPSSSPRPHGGPWSGWPATARSSTSRTAPAGTASSAAPGTPTSTGCSASSTSCTYGLVDPIEDDEVVSHSSRDFGTLPEGSRLNFRVAGNEHMRAFLPVRPVAAEVVAVDQRGRPALLGASRRRPAGAVHLPAGADRGGVGRGSTPSRPGGSTTRSPRSPASAGR